MYKPNRTTALCLTVTILATLCLDTPAFAQRLDTAASAEQRFDPPDFGDHRGGHPNFPWRLPTAVFVGEWESNEEYDSGTVVTYQGVSYLSLSRNRHVTPNTNTSDWVALSAAGLTGPAGAPGPAASAEVRGLEALFSGSCGVQALGKGWRVEVEGGEDGRRQAQRCCPVGFMHALALSQSTCMKKGGTSPQAAMSIVVSGPIS